MKNVKQLLDRAKEATGASNENQLSQKLGIPSQRISDYYKGSRAPDPHACLKIAEALGLELGEVISKVEIDAEKDDKRRLAWIEYAKRIGKIAASFMIVAYIPLIAVTLIVTGEAKAQGLQEVTSDESHTIQIMRLLANLRNRALSVLHKLCSDFPRGGFAY